MRITHKYSGCWWRTSNGRLTVERLADHLSALADATLALAIEYAWRSLTRRHRDAPHFAVIGYGKLGGKELGYESDLDLIFLYDDEDDCSGRGLFDARPQIDDVADSANIVRQVV